MEDSIGTLIGFLLVIAIIAVVIYCIVLIAGALAAIAGAGGVLWGGGTAVVNYTKSFKENMIDSNRVAA